ncbi:serine/threonine protein kinase [Nostoc sp. LEGE 06077]|uniref:serine/threonine-protein kinase n=1 Tax=Nostoc sp. LEGE 06077 TaxID=915325 RepID=UPI001880E3E4|nr:serine/threonine-protein kinase [Nostoc sp. LEGE 06077]MBE9207938.1 serine/threonine protein kinase [Nostoc sp. LEGE 06077]
MQPPITIGTVLQNRYRIIQILGQGGFGRTYLAEDQRRFNELCAIKELIPIAAGAGAWEKAQELFQREATILYQIEHPQVPKFRERFEQDHRLFLVEDYVAGKTYRDLLVEKQSVGQTFSEADVLQLLRSLLPVLEHIHSRGIIHRDISPENIILRDSDRLPVLIDFGVVKELATRLQTPDTNVNVTSVGKLGYSPNEQMQTGRAYPSSDLYALAVTAIVLLTAKEPSELFDETQLTWTWQKFVRVSPQLAQVINRMLHPLPSDRYQSAAEVIQALQFVEQPGVAAAPEVSNFQTIAVGRRPDAIPPQPSNRPDPVIPPGRSSNSVLDNPLALGAIGSAVVILAGFGSWALVSSIRSQSNGQPETTPLAPQTFPSPVISGGTTFGTPTNTEPAITSKRLRLDASNTATVENSLKAGQIMEYTFFGQAGAKLTTVLEQGTGISLTVLTPNRQVLDSSAQQVSSYTGILPKNGRYTVQLVLESGVSESDYNLRVALENPLQPSPTATPTVTPTLTPTFPPVLTPTVTPTLTPTFPPAFTPTPTIPPDNNPPVDNTPQPTPGVQNTP